MGFAGDTLNTAWYLRRLLGPGHEVAFCTAVGMDALSDQMVAFLAQAGLDTSGVLRSSEQTVGLYMIQLSEGERSFSYWRGQSAARTLAGDAKTLQAALDDADIAYFSGITLAILPEQDRSTLLNVLRGFRAGGGMVVFDPNLRPRLWADTTSMPCAITEAATVCDIVLPSFEDEAEWFKDITPADTAKRYRERGARQVIVKNGADPIIALNDSDLSEHMPERVDTIIDTTAAGDSFNAGYLASMINGHTQAEAIRSGAALSAKVIGARGALVP